MKLNAKTKQAIKQTNTIITGKAAKVVKAAKAKVAKVTGNWWSKLKELGSYKYGVKLYALRGSDYMGQALVEWQTVKGATKRMVLFVTGKRGLAMMEVNAKGTVVQATSDKGFDAAQIKQHQLLTKNAAIALIQKMGKREKAFIYDKRTMAGWLLDNGNFYSVFTDGKNIFEGEAGRISGKSQEQAKHVWALGAAKK